MSDYVIEDDVLEEIFDYAGFGHIENKRDEFLKDVGVIDSVINSFLRKAVFDDDVFILINSNEITYMWDMEIEQKVESLKVKDYSCQKELILSLMTCILYRDEI